MTIDVSIEAFRWRGALLPSLSLSLSVSLMETERERQGREQSGYDGLVGTTTKRRLRPERLLRHESDYYDMKVLHTTTLSARTGPTTTTRIPTMYSMMEGRECRFWMEKLLPQYLVAMGKVQLHTNSVGHLVVWH